MIFGNMQPLSYDQFLDITSYSFIDQGLYKTLLFKGDHTLQLQHNEYALNNLLESSYVGHRILHFTRIDGLTHTITLQELELLETKSVSNMLAFLIDPILEYTKENTQSLKFTIDPSIKENLASKNLLQPLYRYVMSRDLHVNRTNKEISHTKETSLKLAQLRAKYKPLSEISNYKQLQLY
jgi:hypothetical protein